MPTGIPMSAETLRKYRTWFMLYGALLAVLGLLAIALPNVATLATGILVGWLLLAGGAFGLIAVFSAGREASGFWWNLFTSLIYVVAGLALLIRPVAGVLTLTIFWRLTFWREASPRWSWHSATNVKFRKPGVGFCSAGYWIWCLPSSSCPAFRVRRHG
jgi:uncharacterized membrane protein HdeD (DUF308 family)